MSCTHLTQNMCTVSRGWVSYRGVQPRTWLCEQELSGAGSLHSGPSFLTPASQPRSLNMCCHKRPSHCAMKL
jgi:hypothetical protein